MLDILQWDTLDDGARNTALARPASSTSEQLSRDVAAIVARVRSEGDAALRAYAREFDGAATEILRVPAGEIASAADTLSPEQREALNRYLERRHGGQDARELEELRSSIEHLQGQAGVTDDLALRVGDLEERLDFAERLLTKERERRERIEPGR